MEETNIQDKVNLVCKFLESAENNDGDKVFLPLIYKEDWKGVLQHIFCEDIRGLKGDINDDNIGLVENCISSLDFLYTFFQELDDINLFSILPEDTLMKSHFNHAGESYSKVVIIPGNVKELPSTFFQNCSTLEKLVFDNSSEVTTLPRGFLLGCKNLKELVITNRVNKIGILAVDPEELPDLKIRVTKSIPGNSWKVQIAGNDDTVEYWKSHIVRD